MFATFGNITFDLLTAPQSFLLKRETEFAEHARINNKPRLQKTGEKLDELTVQVQFHKAFCTPETEIAKFESARKSATINPFVLGTGELVGTFVIASITKTVNDTFSDGTLMCVTLDVQFKEAVSNSPLSDMAQAAVAAAFAVSGDTPLPATPNTSIDANPAAQIDAYVADATFGSAQAATEVAKATANPDYLDMASTAINKATTKVTDALNKVDTVLNANTALKNMATNLTAAVNNARSDANTLQGLLPIQNINDVKNASDALRNSMKVVHSANAPIALVHSYRGIF